MDILVTSHTPQGLSCGCDDAKCVVRKMEPEARQNRNLIKQDVVVLVSTLFWPDVVGDRPRVIAIRIAMIANAFFFSRRLKDLIGPDGFLLQVIISPTMRPEVDLLLDLFDQLHPPPSKICLLST